MTATARLAALTRALALVEASGDDEAAAVLAELIDGSMTPAERRRAALDARDDALRRAAIEYDLMSADLSAALQGYFDNDWLVDKALTDCPARHAGTIASHLWQALRAHPWPVRERQMRTILRQSSPELIAEALWTEKLAGKSAAT